MESNHNRCRSGWVATAAEPSPDHLPLFTFLQRELVNKIWYPR